MPYPSSPLCGSAFVEERARRPACSRVSRAGLSALWLFSVTGIATALGVLSHLGLSTSTTRMAIAQSSRVGFALTGLLALTGVTLAVLVHMSPSFRAQARRLRYLFAGIALTGMPWTFACAAFGPRLGLTDFWALAGLGGLAAFLLWLRTLREGWRGAADLWRTAGWDDSAH